MGTWDLPFISPRDCIAGKRSRSGVHVSPWGGPRPARDVRGQPLPDAAQRAWRLWGSELGMHTLAHAAERAFPAARAGKLGKGTASSQEHSRSYSSRANVEVCLQNNGVGRPAREKNPPNAGSPPIARSPASVKRSRPSRRCPSIVGQFCDAPGPGHCS